MAHLLGSQYCVESLSNDVSDLQSAVADVLSRVGPVRYPSWKFPDKASTDVDIEELLEDYKFSEDEEDNQVAHIMFFEMVIDRMVLLLQSFTRFVEQLIQGTVGRPPTATPMGAQMSIGLVVKKFWNKMVQLNNITQKLSAESRSKGSTVSKLENINAELQDQVRRMAQSANLSGQLLDSRVAFTQDLGDEIDDDQGPLSPLETASPSKLQLTVQTPQQRLVAIDTRTVSSQTLETAFVPCESCERVQLCLKDVGDVIAEVCRSQRLPSSIARQRKTAPGDVMSAADVTRWANEQNKDLDCIKDHLGYLMSQIDPLKADLAASRREGERLKESVAQGEKDLKGARVSHGSEVKQLEARLKEVERQHAESIMVVKRSYEEARGGKKKTEEELTKLKRELQRQHEALKELEGVREELNQTLDANTSFHAAVSRLESHVTQMSGQLRETQEQLTDTSKQLGKEQAKNRSIDKHGQALQSKHDALVQRVDELDQECQDLRDNLADAEDAKEEVAEQLRTAQEEVKGLQDELKTQQDLVASVTEEKQFLENSIGDLQTMILALEDQLKETQERERMLVMYPDTNPGLVPASNGADGDSASGIQQNIQSNNLRIQILEEQNNLLRRNIDQLLAEQPQQHSEMNGPAIPLWQTDSLRHAQQSVNVNNHSNVQARPGSRSGRSPRSQVEGHHHHQDAIRIPNGQHHLSEHLTEEEVIRKYTGHSGGPRHLGPASDEPSSGYQIHPRPPSRKGSKDRGSSSRPKSAKRTSSMTSTNVGKLVGPTNSSLHAYRTLKNSGAIQPHASVRSTDGPDFFVGKRPPAQTQAQARSQSQAQAQTRQARHQAWRSPERGGGRAEGTQSRNSHYEPADTFICVQCDKMYSSKRDLEIHKSYCYP